MSLLDQYAKNVTIRALIQLIPFNVGGAVDVFLLGRLEQIREERARTFFDELAKSEAVLSEEMIKSENFLHKYFSTIKCALNTQRREKIVLFARLLRSSLDINNSVGDADVYEDFLSILDELSFRELKALMILESFYSTSRATDQNDLQWTNVFWDQFISSISESLMLSKDQAIDFMNRIARTGCYEIFTGSYMGYIGGQGKLTPTYFRLKEIISMKAT